MSIQDKVRGLMLVGGKAVAEAAGGRVGGRVGPDAFTMAFDTVESAESALEALETMGFEVEPWKMRTVAEFEARPVYLVRVPS